MHQVAMEPFAHRYQMWGIAHKRIKIVHPLVEETVEMLENCNIQNCLKHIFQGLPLCGVQTGDVP